MDELYPLADLAAAENVTFPAGMSEEAPDNKRKSKSDTDYELEYWLANRLQDVTHDFDKRSKGITKQRNCRRPGWKADERTVNLHVETSAFEFELASWPPLGATI